jgi:hypothetical protein
MLCQITRGYLELMFLDSHLAFDMLNLFHWSEQAAGCFVGGFPPNEKAWITSLLQQKSVAGSRKSRQPTTWAPQQV